MFEFLKQYEQIIVTGPQRSGTTICGKMAAQDLNYNYVDEFCFKVADQKVLRELMGKSKGNVFQAPGLFRFVHEFESETTAIIVMRRNIEDIKASEKRIDWKCHAVELMRYKKEERFGLTHIAEIKYAYFDQVQKPIMRHYYEVFYRDLESHPLFVEKALRVNFNAKQTEVKEGKVDASSIGMEYSI